VAALVTALITASSLASAQIVPYFTAEASYSFGNGTTGQPIGSEINGGGTPQFVLPATFSGQCVPYAEWSSAAERGLLDAHARTETSTACCGCFSASTVSGGAHAQVHMNVVGPPGLVLGRLNVIAEIEGAGAGGFALSLEGTQYLSGTSSGAYSTNYIQFSTTFTYRLNLDMTLSVMGLQNQGPFEQRCRLTFPRVGPVMDLPPGYTVNIPDLNVFDNQWLGPVSVPFVMLDPQSQSSCAGADLDLSVGAVGAGLTYQWRRNGVALVDGIAPSGAVISGALSNMLSVDGLGASDAGAYDCVVSGTYGTDTSAPANVSVGAIATYGTAKVNSLGCTPTIGWSGCPSATSNAPFLVTASNVLNQRQGLMFYGYAPTAVPYSGGFRLVAAPIKRSPIMNSAGNPASVSDCSGNYAYDMNARIQLGTDPNLVVGATVCCQYWTRDPADSFGIGLTDALSFVIGD
jgi:hypothetical protein